MLVRGAAGRAGPANKPIGQKHSGLFVIGLLDHATFDQIFFRQAMIGLFYQLAVFFGVGRVKIVKLDHEPA